MFNKKSRLMMLAENTPTKGNKSLAVVLAKCIPPVEVLLAENTTHAF